MGHKINANSLRLGISKGWKSIWFNDSAAYEDQFLQDLKIKNIIKKALNPAGLDSVVVKRSANKMEIEVHVARPGVAIGRGGSGIDDLQKQIKEMTKMDVEIKIAEVKKPDLSARIIARAIADGIERRQPPKLLMVSFKQKAMLAGAKGIRIWVAGRIGGASQARTIKESAGQVPLQTIKANIDYAEERAETVELGILGVKVWIFTDKNSKDSNNK